MLKPLSLSQNLLKIGIHIPFLWYEVEKLILYTARINLQIIFYWLTKLVLAMPGLESMVRFVHIVLRIIFLVSLNMALGSFQSGLIIVIG